MVELEQTTMLLIIHSGNARSLAYEAFDVALAGDYDAAASKLQEAHAELGQAHTHQTGLIQNEAAGRSVTPTLLLIHAQDHLMTAMAEVNLTERMVKLMQVRDQGRLRP